MAEWYRIPSTFFTRLSSAVRRILGTSATYTPSEMLSAVEDTTVVKTSGATARAEDILQGATAFVDGQLITGILQQASASNSVKVATGTFSATSSTSVTVTFDEELDAVPDLIIFHETTASYNSSNRIKFAAGTKDTPLYCYLYNNTTTRYITEVYVRGSTSNSTSFYYATSADFGDSGITYKGTGTGSPIKNATTTGFTAHAYSSTYTLRGTYRYYAICFG